MSLVVHTKEPRGAHKTPFSLMRAVSIAAAGALAAGVISAVPAQAAESAPKVDKVEVGKTIRVSGTGWTTENGSAGSIIALKLDAGAVTRNFKIPVIPRSTAVPGFWSNNTIWGVADADSSGDWSVDLPFPTAANSNVDPRKWGAGSSHELQLLTGSLLTGDPVRNPRVSFTVHGPTATSVAAAKQTYGKAASLNVSVSPNATGPVTATIGSRKFAGRVTNGKGSITVPGTALKPGRHGVSVAFNGGEGFDPSTSKASTLTVAKAKPTVRAALAKKKVKRGKVATVRVRVAAPGVKVSGKATVNVAGVKKNVTIKNGKANVKVHLPKKMKPGAKKVQVTFRANALINGGKSKVAKFRVTK